MGTKLDKLGQDVIEAIADYMDAPSTDITPQSKTLDDLQFDSLDGVNLQMHLEDEFDIQIPDDEFDNLQTVADIIALVRRKVEANE